MAFLECSIDDPLYHYTSESSFWGIVENGNIWFSDLRNSNDPREVVYGAGKLAEICSEVLRRFVGDKNYGEFHTIFDSALRTSASLDVFSFSLSRRVDSIPMWKAYSLGGTGIAFSFRERALRDFPCRIQEVVYLKNNKEESDLQNLLSSYMSKHSALKRNLDLISSIEISTAILSSILGGKHSSWDYENEVRCVYTQVPQKEWLDGWIPVSQTPDGKDIGFRKPDIRESSGGPVRFLKMAFGKFSRGEYNPKGAIQYIVLGPNYPGTIADVTSRLEVLGYFGFVVTRSPLLWR